MGIRSSILESESKELIDMRQDLFPIYVCLCLLSATGFLFSGLDVLYSWTKTMQSVLTFTHLGLVFACKWSTISPRLLFKLHVPLWLMLIMSADAVANAARFASPWVFAVVLLDAMLAFNIETIYQAAVLVVLTAYCIVANMEFSYRFGMYEASYYNRRDIPISVCECADPPCGEGMMMGSVQICMYLTVFFSDFYITRRFAITMRQQMVVMRATADVVTDITKMLSVYSVCNARKVLDRGEYRLDPDLADALGKLITNLEEYRPYLPESLLGADCTTPDPSGTFEETPIQPPSATESVCICFTDIQASTALWEASPQGMHEGLTMHNTAVRKCAHSNLGYEVKTIGDAFMLAFGSAVDAVAFGVDVQRTLLKQSWAESLLANDLCRQQFHGGHPLWNGLRVRVGMHAGEVRQQLNPVTKRCDYFGPTVNLASRVESSLKFGGLTGVTDSVLAALSVDDLLRMGSPCIVARPPADMKGVSEQVVVHVVLPPELGYRVVWVDRGMDTVESASDSHSVISTDSWRRHRRASLPGARNLILGFRRSEVSCAVVRAAQDVTDYHDVVCAIQTCADSTAGELHAVLSSAAVVTWNTRARSCEAHTLACMQFLRLLRRFDHACQLSCGATAGDALCGNVAGTRSRFAIVQGPCVEIAAALAEEAQLCRDHGLVAGAVAERGRAMKSVYRAQVWRFDGRDQPTIVWEFVVVESGYVEMWDVAQESSGGFQPTIEDEVYDRALLHASGAGPEAAAAVEDMLSLFRDDDRTRHLIARIQSGSVRSRTVPWAWYRTRHEGGLCSTEL